MKEKYEKSEILNINLKKTQQTMVGVGPITIRLDLILLDL